jgi:site-specific recombinase XerD
MKVSAILKGMIDSNGHQPIQISIYHQGERRFIPTHIKVNPSMFENGRVNGKHPKARQYNETISNKIIQYQAEALSGLKKKKQKTELYSYLNKTIATLTRSPATVRYYNSQINKLKSFAPSLFIQDITLDFLNDYKGHLRQLGNEGNTLWSSFKFLKVFIKSAMREKLITENPFDSFQAPKYNEPDRVYLTSEEVKKLDSFVQKKIPPKLKEAATWFLIGCHTGMRISDIENFSSKNIVAGRLVFKTQKTREVVGLPLLPKVKKYLELVKYERLSMHRNTYNDLIKTAAAGAGIDKHITSHTARHTAAMLLANAGVSQEVTAKILGHKSLKHTSTYYKITNQRIDMEIKKAMK